MLPRRFILPALLLVAALGSGDVAAQGAVAPPLTTSTFGNWSLSAAQDAGLRISNQQHPDAVRLKLSHGCNGWFLLETTAGQFIMWTAGGFSTDSFTFDDDKPDAGAPALQPGSSHVFGSWSLRVTAAEVLIDHDANPHTIVLPRDSDGWIEVRGTSRRGDLRLNPGDDLAGMYP